MVTRESEDASVYAPPKTVDDLAHCSFYHTMEVPGFGLVEGEWDLRPRVKSYLGDLDFRGKRVLELGTADGYLTFYMEREGAEVVSYDVSEKDRYDTVPFARVQASRSIEQVPAQPPIGSAGSTRSSHPASEDEFLRTIRKLNNAYWLCHRAFGSSARLVHGDIYSVPSEIGTVDVSVFGAILLHTRDPFLALTRAAALTRETVVVTEGLGVARLPAPLRSVRNALPPQFRRPMMRFIPDWRTSEGPHGWWRLSPEIVQAFVGVLGFEQSKVTTHVQLYNGRPRRLFTVVAHRTVPAPEPAR